MLNVCAMQQSARRCLLAACTALLLHPISSQATDLDYGGPLK